jgi:hypothetical protein
MDNQNPNNTYNIRPPLTTSHPQLYQPAAILPQSYVNYTIREPSYFNVAPSWNPDMPQPTPLNNEMYTIRPMYKHVYMSSTGLPNSFIPTILRPVLP